MGHGVDFAVFHEQTFYEVFEPQLASDWILCGDCSFIPKSGKKTHGLALFWNGCASKQQKGLEISGFALVNTQSKSAYMVDVLQTPGDLSDAEGDKDTYTRIDFYLEHLQRVYRRYSWIRYVALDGYYSKMKVFEYFDSKPGLHLIGKLRKDSNLMFPLDRDKFTDAHGNRKYDAKFDHENPMSQKDKWTCKGRLEGEPDVIVYQALMYSPYFKKTFNVALCWHERLQKHILLYSDDLELDALLIVRYYKSRFQIEFLFRDAKQFCGLNHAQVRDEKKLDFHFNTSFAVVNLGRVINEQNKDAHNSEEFSFNNAKRLGYNDLLLHEFIANLDIDPELPKIQQAWQKTRTFGIMHT